MSPPESSSSGVARHAAHAGPDKKAPDVASDVDAFVHQRFVDMFLDQNKRSQAGLLVGAALLAFIWAGRSGPDTAGAWFAVAVLIAAARFVFTDRFVRGGVESSTRRIALVIFVNGVLLATPLLAFDRFSDLERAAVTIVLVASATASVATTAGYRSIFLAFALPMFLPLSAAWALWRPAGEGAVAALGLAVLVLLFLVVLIGVGKQAYRVFDESCRIRYGEKRLNEELSSALERASEANRAKTQFLAAASHDLRQPIHSLNVLVAALTQRDLDARSREIVSLLGSVNQALSAELDGLLEISKLDAGAVKPDFSIVRLDRLAATHHATLLPLTDEFGLACRLTLHHEISVCTDATMLLRVLSNLTSNAVKFTRRGGTVDIAVWREGTRARLAVSDTGVGIAAEEHERVFREFYQVGNVERDRSRGLGLGLSIVQRACSLLGVAVQLQSQPGHGTTVTLDLASVAPTPDTDRAVTPTPPRLPAGLSVLMIDDDVQVRESMRLLLSELGCTVHTADSTLQATRIAAQHRVDVVLSDLRLRGEDNGLLAMQAVRRVHPSVRLVLVTGDTAPDRINEARAAGVPLLHKPLTMAQVLAALHGDNHTPLAAAQRDDFDAGRHEATP